MVAILAAEFFGGYFSASRVTDGPIFSDTRSEVISGGNMFGAVGYLQCSPGQRVVPYNNC